MLKISEESYERVAEILEDIGYSCETDDDFEEWEDVARASFATILDELDTNQFNMTCAVIKEGILYNCTQAGCIVTSLGAKRQHFADS